MASRRGYLSQAELSEFADITITDPTEADDQISQAEELIDAYVGAQPRFLEDSRYGECSSGTTSIVVDAEPGSLLDVTDGFYVGCEIEIIGGLGAGQRRIITASSKVGKSVTVSPVFTTAPDSSSRFKIYQLGKFPRNCDVETNRAGTAYYKAIPEAVKRATAAQVQFFIEKGAAFFAGDNSDLTMEKIDDYQYERGGSSGVTADSTVALISPKARTLLNGIMRRVGQLDT